ncbi:response regulator [Aquimarina sp. U1-2]|uniref:response regulator n=1 Tax=Aquimarina sp. U1-2 TaxID=2823141 RepID=UPI001AECF550|nr:response regulator [Aquimarina sp. U1-2]MBP2831313.1 response regulator [Aquimarina sp. U1-2]
MSQNIESVCIIDDDSMYISLLSKIIKLKQLSETIIVFNNGREAMNFFQESITTSSIPGVPQVIFLDLNMPIMDGWEFLNEFSKIKHQFDEKINLYVVSSSIDERDIKRVKSIAWVSNYLVKPITIDNLERLLK